MSAHVVLKIRLGPMVLIEAEGTNCEEISHALSGWEALNKKVDGLCSDLAQRIYPDGEIPHEDDHDEEHHDHHRHDHDEHDHSDRKAAS